jgi:5-methylcytosine-specific restriction endonuclease McrA
MRPVAANKGGQGAYPFSLASNLSNTTWTFQQGNAVTANRLYKTNSPTARQCLETWLSVAKVDDDQLAKPQDYKWRKQIVTAVGNRIGDIYRQAATPLTTQLGSFCSYCEIPLLATIEVEHIAPKSEYPMFCLAWENFLLACGPCNKLPAKDSKPNRVNVVDDWLAGAQPPLERTYYDEIRGHYVWPDRDAAAYRLLRPRLEYYRPTQDDWVLAPKARSVRVNQRWVSTDIGARTVTANIYTTDTVMANRLVRVMLRNETNYATQMIDLCKLNSDGKTVKDGTSDRRLIQRTEVWFGILEALDVLNDTVPTKFDKAWNGLLSVSKRLGFYSLWVQILYQSKLKNPNTNTWLVTDFVNNTNVAGLYPNTNDTEVP